ncbi:unnamed protein product, partial [Aureobasidium uvarum]
MKDASECDSRDTSSDDFVDVPAHRRSEGDGTPIIPRTMAYDLSLHPPIMAYDPNLDPRYKILRTGQRPGYDEWIPASALTGSFPLHSTQDDTITQFRCFEDYAKSAQAERDFAERKCEEIQFVAIAEKERLQKHLTLAKEDLESMRFLRDQDKADLESLRSFRDSISQDLAEAKAQLAAIESQRIDPTSSCQTCRCVVDENLRVLFKNKDLEAQLEQSARDAEKAQESIAGGNNTFAVIDKVIAKQRTEIAEHKAEVDEYKAEIARLRTKIAELQVSEPSSDSVEEKERAHEGSIEHSETVEHCKCYCPLIMRITVWVGGASGKDTDLALVKMDPDTPFKAVLEDMRRHHPLKVLRQKSTGRYIFDSDTPSDLAMKNEEELDFIQECGEPLYMLDATTDGAKSWRGKNSRI